MDLRRIPGDQPIHISPTHDFEPSAPSPDSIAASPMISARMSDCAEMPLESDDGGDACSLASRRSTFSNKMDLYDLTKDTDFQKKFPEICRLVMANSKPKGDAVTSEDKIVEEIREMYRENRELKKSLRQQRKYNEKLTEENRQIKENWGRMYAQAEQEEEFISNTLLKRINQARNEKEIMAQRHEQELQACQQTMERRIEEYYNERETLEKKLKEEYTKETSNLERIVRGLQQDLNSFRTMCDRLRSEKVDQENALEHEQELLFNTLGKQMDQLNGEKRTLQASLEKACHMGFVDPELDLTVLHPPPLVFKEQLHNCNGEVMRLRVQLKRTEGQVNELKEKDAIKEAKIRALEENQKNLKWYKERYNKMRHMIATEVPPPELIADSPQSLARDVNMGPPSVPPTPRSIDNSSDMDETASYPASVDMN